MNVLVVSHIRASASLSPAVSSMTQQNSLTASAMSIPQYFATPLFLSYVWALFLEATSFEIIVFSSAVVCRADNILNQRSSKSMTLSTAELMGSVLSFS